MVFANIRIPQVFFNDITKEDYANEIWVEEKGNLQILLPTY